MHDKGQLEKTLLIVEEDEDLSDSLALFFANKFNVKVVKDQSSLQDSLATANILLIDASIIDNTSIELLQSIKISAPHIIIIIMNQFSSKSYSSDPLYKQYSDAVVFKPFDANHIYKIISQIANKNS